MEKTVSWHKALLRLIVITYTPFIDSDITVTFKYHWNILYGLLFLYTLHNKWHFYRTCYDEKGIWQAEESNIWFITEEKSLPFDIPAW